MRLTPVYSGNNIINVDEQILALAPLVKSLCWNTLIFFIVMVCGYVAAASSLYWFLYLRPSSQFSTATVKISSAKIWRSIRNDVSLAVSSFGIFSACAALVLSAYTLGYTQIYLQPQRHGLWYIGVSLVLVLLLQDTYFYFTHRLAHHPYCYKWLHRGHHCSKNPTPWTAFAFDPAEAIVQAIYLIGVAFMIPMHLSVLVAVVLIMTIGALSHHVSLRLFESSAWGTWLGSWMIGPTHHWLHHRKHRVHYSLYFTFWDKLLGTHYPNYEDFFSPMTKSLR